MKRSLLLFSLFIHSWILSAQTLEEINFSVSSTISLNTYTTDINNSGFVCGYYENLSAEKIGYVITPRGKRILFTPSQFPSAYTHISVEGINDSCTIIINATTSTNSVDMYKAYFNKETQQYTIQAINGSWQPGLAKPYGINNKNVYSGWYPNATDRFGFLMNDSSLSSIPFWNAKQYNFLPTYLYKGNDNDLYAGYYIDAGLNTPAVFNAQSNTFAVLPFTNNMKPRDLNNNNIICGEYKQVNGFYCGFYGTYNGSSITNFSSVNSIFSSNTVQNILNAVNDSMAFVGSYLHPVTNTWVGFIYRPNQNEYRLPKFNYAQDTWTKLLNNAGSGSTDVFSPNYYNNFNYSSEDPFTQNGQPVLNQAVLTMFPGVQVPNGTSVAWRGFCEESNLGNAAKLVNATNVLLYENNFKPLLFAKYAQTQYTNGFSGYCFGFSYSALAKKYRPDLFSTWYNKPVNFDISQAQNTDTVSVLAIERAYLKQYDPVWANAMFPITVSYWQGMYRFKNEYLKDSASVNPQSLGIGLGINAATPNGGHNVLPYKIRTPKKFPFNFPTVAMDTLFVYDSNYPNDSSQYFAVKASFVQGGEDTALNSSYSVGSNNAYQIRFQKVGLRDSLFKEYSNLNKTRGPSDSMFQFNIERNLYYQLKNASQQVMKFDATGFSNACSNITPIIPEGLFIDRPKLSRADTNTTFTLSSYNYLDSVMQWGIHKNYLTMGISRKALPAEKDYSTWNHRLITYGNPDNVSKELNCYFIQIKENATQATTVLVNGLTMASGDSLVTANPSDYVYTITKIGSGNTTYDLSTYTFSNDSAKQFSVSNIPLDGNSTHAIQSFYPTGGTVVYIDQGLNNVYDDTLFVPEIPLGIGQLESQNALNVKVYPQPAQDELRLEMTQNTKEAYDVIVSDIGGKIIARQTNISFNQGEAIINCSNWTPGQYILFIRNKQEQVVFVQQVSKQ